MNYTPLSKKLLGTLPKLLSAPKRKKLKNYPNLDNGGPGRNSKYDPNYVEKADIYLNTIKAARKKGSSELPTLEGFSDYLGVDHETLLNWANKKIDPNGGDTKSNLANPAFFEALKRIKNYQKHLIISDGFYGGKKVNAGMGVFLLKANYGMRDNNDDSKKEDGNTFNFNMVNYG